MARRIEVEIIGDSRSLERAFARSAASATRFEAKVRGVSRGLSTGFKTLAGAFGIAFTFDKLVQGVEHSINAAEDLNKEMSKSRVVFGEAEASVVAWSKTTADALGINQAEALQAASNFGILFDRLGKGRQVSADMSTHLVELAADVASFFHASSSDVLNKFLRGLYGQARGLKVLGINLTAARVQNEAYASGIAKVGSKLTEAQKVQARYNIILRDTAPEAGNFARHSGDWANVQAKLNAVLEDFAATLGEKLLPFFRRFASRFEKWIGNADNQKTVIDDLTVSMDALAAAAQAAATGFSALHTAGKWMEGHKLGWLKYALFTPFPQQVAEHWPQIKSYLVTGKPPPGPPGKMPKAAQWFGQPIPKGLQTSVPGYEWSMATGRPPGTQYVPTRRPDRARAAALRNTWFDNTIARQLDRVQDLGLRKQLERLRAIAAEVQARIAITKDTTRRLTLEDKLLEIYRQERAVQADITDQIKQANKALKDRADAIKSAILDRLQRKQQDVENKRALQDAKDQLRLALALGGPKGIQAARRAVADARMAVLITRAEGARPSLTRGGQFALGNIITINIHGVTDPDKVARMVVAAINKRGRHTSSQSRGPGAGATAGTH